MKRKNENKLLSMFIKHVRENTKEYIILFIIFIIGVVLGTFFINHVSDEQKQEITSYINTFISSLKENSKIDFIGLLKDSLLKNISLALILWFIGSTVTFTPFIYGVIVFRGFCLGYTISSVIAILGARKRNTIFNHVITFAKHIANSRNACYCFKWN